MKPLRNLVLILFLASCSAGTSSSGSSPSTPFSGEGTEENPYLISSKEDLFSFADLVNEGQNFEGKIFRQTVDIDVGNETWIPIGSEDSKFWFSGVYDGNGYTISHLEVNQGVFAGFFGQLGGICMNLGIVDSHYSAACVGSIACHSASIDAVVFNCYALGNRLDGVRTGGIADNFNGTIICCASDCLLLGTEARGGICSYNVLSASHCYATSSPFPAGQKGLTDCEQVHCLDGSVVSSLNHYAYEGVGNLVSHASTNGWTYENEELDQTGKMGFRFFTFLRMWLVPLLPYLALLATAIVITVMACRKKAKED